ncbi:cytochrome P450 [Blastococcus sp. Marseille-P5729]|uniref:cytochrome P450 n=1 Tax=Blastococcus sp. Marseille-P5729 TaxID=2086582 RepID=UPI0018FE90DB|nr:cytochrome P450 [Blastococcus sp. Marseille-P5729]
MSAEPLDLSKGPGEPMLASDGHELPEGVVKMYPSSHGIPVADWATDFDHADPAYNKNAHEIWDDLREKCPIAHSNRYGGTWLPTTHADVRAIAYDTDNFTSRQVVVVNGRIDPAMSPIGQAPPITSDPPFHQMARKLLLSQFRPNKIDPLEDEIREICRQRLDDLGEITPGETVIDAATQYAQHIPPAVISRMLGFPPEDDDKFRYFIYNVLENIDAPPEEKAAFGLEFNAYLDEQIQAHVENPRDDLTTYLLNSEIGGQPLAHETVRGAILLLLIAGIDTTWSAIGASLWHLAQNPADVERLRNDPDVMIFALEEFLRAYAPVTMARLVKQDVEFNGCPMKEEDFVLLPFPAANRDPEFIENADKFIIDRQVNRHSAFGLGIHRCLGSNLARLELKVAIEEFVNRFPDFSFPKDGDQTKWSVGQIRGPRSMPILIR